jgi:hypothetical protein
MFADFTPVSRRKANPDRAVSLMPRARDCGLEVRLPAITLLTKDASSSGRPAKSRGAFAKSSSLSGVAVKNFNRAVIASR